MSGVERKRLNITLEGAYDGNPGAAIIADAVFDAQSARLVVFDTSGNEIARAEVNRGDDPWTVARNLLPRPRQSDFWRPMPSGLNRS